MINRAKANKMYSISDFCKMYRISQKTFAKWESNKTAPPITCIDSEKFITEDALDDWHTDKIGKNYQVYRIKDFCKMHHIAQSTFHKWRKEGNAPAVVKMRKVVFITREALEKWYRRFTDNKIAERICEDQIKIDAKKTKIS